MIPTRVISLDLDDTLWPVGPVIAAAEEVLLSWLRAHHPHAVQDHDVDTMRALRGQMASRFPEYSHDMTFLRQRALAEQFTIAARVVGTAGAAPLSAADEASVAEAMEVFFVERNRVRLYDDVRPALQRLRTRYRLFALSNGNADLRRCGIDDLFDGHVTAAAAGAGKPDARIFAHLLELAGVEAGEVLHVGDDPLADVVGATRAGMQCAWLNRDGRPWPTHYERPSRTITTLEQLP